MPTSRCFFKDNAAARGMDEYDSNEEVTSVPPSSSRIKHEYEHVAPAFANEAATKTEELESHDLDSKPSASAADDSVPSPVKKRRIESPSSPAAYGTLGFNHTFAYPAHPHGHVGFAAAFPGHSPHPASHSDQLVQQQQSVPVFPGQSPPFQSSNHHYFGVLQMAPQVPSSSSSSINPADGMAHPQPLVVTHIPPGATYATVPYPYHINYPTGQPLIQHPNGNFYPAIMNVVSSDHPDPNATLLSRIVDDPPNPPHSALGQPKKWVRWTDTEDHLLKRAVKKYGEDKMDLISKRIFYDTRDVNQCRQRWKKALQPGLVKGKWTKEEDSIITEMVKASSFPGGGSDSQTKWSDIAKRLPGRLGEQVKSRWVNHLDPNIRKGAWTKTEMDLLVEAQKELGNKWADIAKRIPGRSENSVKNRWYNAKTQEKRKEEKAREGDERRESNETVNSLIFKTEEEHETRLA